jgi:hypothetical protein
MGNGGLPYGEVVNTITHDLPGSHSRSSGTNIQTFFKGSSAWISAGSCS